MGSASLGDDRCTCPPDSASGSCPRHSALAFQRLSEVVDAKIASRPRIDWLLDRVRDELTKALGKFDSFNSPHEGKAVIEEELDELWQHVKANTGRYSDAMDEAIQVAAMALRYVHDLAEWGPK